MYQDFISPTLRLHPYPGKLSRAMQYLRQRNIMATDQGSEFVYRSYGDWRNLLSTAAYRRMLMKEWE